MFLVPNGIGVGRIKKKYIQQPKKKWFFAILFYFFFILIHPYIYIWNTIPSCFTSRYYSILALYTFPTVWIWMVRFFCHCSQFFFLIFWLLRKTHTQNEKRLFSFPFRDIHSPYSCSIWVFLSDDYL